jgi:hypothetical protein
VVRDGAYVVRDKWSDTYPPTTQIIHAGTGPSDLTPPVDDTLSVVDEYLVVTQGPDIHTPGASAPEAGGGTVESREPGKTGERGWTDKAGFAKFHSKDEGKTDETQAEGAPKDEKGDKPKKKGKKRKKSEGT